jgi:hypothetical protein
MILNTIDELKRYLGRAINKATTLDFIQPYIQLAQDTFLVPAFGSELIEELEAGLLANPSTLTAEQYKLLAYLQRALAFYAYVKYLPYSLGTDGDNGLQEQGTDKTQPVRMGVHDKRLRESHENAAVALETALHWLLRNRAKFPTWTASESYQLTAALFCSSATELTEYLPQVNGSYRLFLSLSGYLRRAEQTSIKPLIGSPLYDDLKAKRVAGSVLTPTEIRLMDAVSRAAATTAYAKALYHLNVQQTTGGGLRILSDFDGIYNQKAVDAALLMDAQRKADTDRVASLNDLSAYLQANRDQYPLYVQAFPDVLRGPNEFPDNSSYKGVFRMR